METHGPIKIEVETVLPHKRSSHPRKKYVLITLSKFKKSAAAQLRFEILPLRIEIKPTILWGS